MQNKSGAATSLEDLTAPPDPETAQKPASVSERAALAISLLLATFGVAVPGVVMLWFLSATLTTGITAEALEQTGGLEPTTFGGGYWLAMGVDAGIVLWSLIRRLRGRPAPWTPLAWLIVAYLALIWFVVFPDAATGLDAPDVITTFVLLGADALVSYVLPVMLLVLMLHALKALWRAGVTSSMAAQRVGIAAACLGLASVTVGIALAVVELEPKTLDVAAAEFVSALDVDGVEGERQVYAAMSLGLGSGLSSGGATSRVSPAFGECAETLSERRVDKGPVVDQATRILISKGLGKADAEDVVMDTLLRVCLQHAKERRRDLISYYWQALSNNARSAWRRTRRDQVGWDDDRFGDDRTLPGDARLDWERNRKNLHAALARLSAADQLVLALRHVDGLSYAEMGARLGKREAAVRQQVKRARERLRHAWKQVADRR